MTLRGTHPFILLIPRSSSADRNRMPPLNAPSFVPLGVADDGARQLESPTPLVPMPPPTAFADTCLLLESGFGRGCVPNQPCDSTFRLSLPIKPFD